MYKMIKEKEKNIMTREVFIKPPWTMTKYSFDMSIAYYNKKEKKKKPLIIHTKTYRMK